MTNALSIVTWNVNSIRVRTEHIRAFLEAERPDLLCLQETKVQDHEYPHDAFEPLGYTSHIFGQKTYNGVAFLTPHPIEIVARGFPGEGPDDQKRLISARLGSLEVHNVYIPNGESVESDKFQYKQRFLEKLTAWTADRVATHPHQLLCGDFNIAPAALDLHDPEGMKETCMFHSLEHAQLDRLRGQGFADVFRHFHPDLAKAYSWWDYRNMDFRRNKGYRIDHIWVTPSVLAGCEGCEILKAERKKDKPSDHAPVRVVLRLP